MNLPSLLIVDTETSGVDAQVDHLVEVGAVLYDPVFAAPIESRAVLIAADSNAASAINGIPEPLLREGWCTSRDEATTMIGQMLRRGADVRGDALLCAHNAAFDRQWLPQFADHRWLCTLEDASWPRVPGETGGLTAIALAYGVGVTRAHRALEDCLTLAAVLSRVHELEGGLEDWLARALEEKVEIVAMVSFQEKDKAKNAGFRWQADRRLWTRKIRVSQVESYRASLDFRTRVGG